MKFIFLVAVTACLYANTGGFAQTIDVRPRPGDSAPTFIDLHGRVVDENGKPLSGATVTLKGTSIRAITGSQGKFSIRADSGQTLIVANAGYDDREILIGPDNNLTIQLELSLASLLNTTVVNKGYYTTTQRLNTGNVSTIKAAEIEEQPVGNPLAALEGRAPGLFVTQSNGLPGAGFSTQVRGQHSILAGNGPLYLIDGVPFTNNSISLVAISANGPQSPFNSINPADIESVEVLKDADATAIYGSRGANGVVLITTKKGRTGKTKLELNVYTGSGKITRMQDLLNTRQYIQMRREAFANDNLSPDIYSAPDLTAWDTTRYTDWKRMLIGGTAHITDAQASLSGGNAQTQFFLGAGFHRETTVFPGEFADSRGAVHFNFTHSSPDDRFKATLTVGYTTDKINLIGQDLTNFIRLSPNAPALYDTSGKLNWSEGGAGFSNPLAYLLQKSNATADNLLSNLVLRYQLLPGLDLKANLGYNSMQLQQEFIYPGASVDPMYNFTGFAEYSENNFKSWIIEPQAEYGTSWGRVKLELLAGTSFQQQRTNGSITYASNFSSDALLGSPSAAGNVSVANNNTLYRYQAGFGRISLNWGDKYLLNLTGRRDGSSRFGPNRQFSNFGAIGAAWIFSKEAFIKDNLPALKYGKLRGSFGITGDDQIGDYQYLNTYIPNIYPYQGQAGLIPAQLYNPEYSWETNRKLELGLELGFLDERIVATVSYYRDRSSNELINYTLPVQTGFNSIIRNFPALVQNTGWEYQLNTTIIKTKRFTWNTSLNVTFSDNKLLEFPNLASSAYAANYAIGHSLSIVKLVHQTGVDPQTGIYHFTDKDGHLTSAPSFPDDYVVIKDLAPDLYGGLRSFFQYKNFSLSIFFQFVKQKGFSYVYNNPTPGSMSNQPAEVLHRWRKPGDITDIQLYTTTNPGAAAYYYYSYSSDGAVGDASFIRLKNAALTYTLPAEWSGRIKTGSIKVFLQGLNLVTWTKYKGGDPEIRNSFTLPPLKIFTAGINVIF